ncbi:MAG: hypothetical protein RL264_2384 [Bacteroidota bacterium]|jgi:hypothetical protein
MKSNILLISLTILIIVLLGCELETKKITTVAYKNDKNEVLCKGKIDQKHNKNNWYYKVGNNKIGISWYLKKYKSYKFYVPKEAESEFKNIVVFDIFFKKKDIKFQFFFIENKIRGEYNIKEIEELVFKDIDKKDDEYILEKRFRIENYSFSQYEILKNTKKKDLKLMSLFMVDGKDFYECRVYFKTQKEKLVKLICFDMIINILRKEKNLYNYEVINTLLETNIIEINKE